MSWVKVNAYLATIPQSDSTDDKDQTKDAKPEFKTGVLNADDMEDGELDKLLGAV